MRIIKRLSKRWEKKADVAYAEIKYYFGSKDMQVSNLFNEVGESFAYNR